MVVNNSKGSNVSDKSSPAVVSSPPTPFVNSRGSNADDHIPLPLISASQLATTISKVVRADMEETKVTNKGIKAAMLETKAVKAAMVETKAVKVATVETKAVKVATAETKAAKVATTSKVVLNTTPPTMEGRVDFLTVSISRVIAPRLHGKSCAEMARTIPVNEQNIVNQAQQHSGNQDGGL